MPPAVAVPDELRCHAHSKQTGERCKQRVVPGRTVCHYHGGKTPRGIDHPNFKTGLSSRDLPTRLAATFQRALEEPARLELDPEIAAIDSILVDRFRSLGPDATTQDIAQLSAELIAIMRAGADFRKQETQRRQLAKESLTLKEAHQVIGGTISSVVKRSDEALEAMLRGADARVCIAAMREAIRQDVARLLGVGATITEPPATI